MSSLLSGRSYLFPGSGAEAASVLAEFSAFDQIIADATELDVKALRLLINQAQLSAETQRLLLIKSAEALSDIMQNTLLKLLEEPPSTLVIVLQTQAANRLIPTVASRLQPVNFKSVQAQTRPTVLAGSTKQLFDQLSKLPKEDLISNLEGEMTHQRQLLLAEPTSPAGERIDLLDRVVKKLRANANQKLSLDWLLLHWGSN